ENFDVDLYSPFKDVPKKALDQILYGSGDEKIELRWRTREGKTYRFHSNFKGIVTALKRRHARPTTSQGFREEIEKYMQEKTCPDCKGARLKPETLAVTVNNVNIAEISKQTVNVLSDFFDHLPLTKRETIIAQIILKEVKSRLRFLNEVGLGYISLDRKADTLAGGEAQRIRLATQIGSRLTGVLYVLDEPTIGLHPRDNEKLISTLFELRELGNTLVVVEHDEETIRRADYVVDLGPGAGKDGGHIVAVGPPSHIEAHPKSLTGQYLSGRRAVPGKSQYRSPNGKFIEIRGARVHNLQNLDINVPLGMFVCFTGVSGSGKSTLLENVLYEGFKFLKQGLPVPRAMADAILGGEAVERVVLVDQAPIGRTPRSNPVTYTKAFDEIRRVFESLPESKARGYGPGRFSFNVRGGRCEACEGAGAVLVEMHFLPDVYVTCEICGGKRYNRETLEITYKGKNIAEVLDLTVSDAVEFFASHPRILRILQTLNDVGLGYIHLGQPATTLSGGEAQRVKLATELWKRGKDNLYLLDEPTTGLHFADVEKLLDVLDRLVDAGNTVIVIEHNRDVMRRADYLIDLGPEGGAGGGRIVAQGSPQRIAAHKSSFTGLYLRPYFTSTKPALRPRKSLAAASRKEPSS
ncbi:MAG: excinuclease ABC subunit UvrA, partial [bacterium]